MASEDLLEEDGLSIRQKQKSIVDHLQSPRKKKKNYVGFALTDSIDQGLKQRIEYHIKMNFPNLTVVYIKELKELAKMYSREINLLLMSDDFSDVEQIIEIIKRFKEKNRKTGMPVLFFTKNPKNITNAYNSKLLAYQEIDDYIEWEGKSEKSILNTVGSMLDVKNRRKSRRFPYPFRMKYADLRTGSRFDGIILDLSMHGGLIQKNKDAPLFNVGDQIKIVITWPDRIDKFSGEAIALFGKVRRCVIGGEKAGISWEQLSDSKSTALMAFITKISDATLEKQNWAKKAEIAYSRKSPSE